MLGIGHEVYAANAENEMWCAEHGGNRYGDGIQKKKKWNQPVGTKSGGRAGVVQGLHESILQGGGVPLSFKV